MNIEKKEKFVVKTSIITKNELYEMVFDRDKNSTSYTKVDRSGHIEKDLSEVEVNGIKYQPLSPNSNLIEKGVMLFSSTVVPYEDEKEILNDIKIFIHKYLDISEVFEQIATYYVLFTWLYDRFNEVPYLRAIGDFGSGKSRFIQTIGMLCYKPVFTSGATSTAPIFRILNESKGTLVLDEADFKFSDMTSDIVKILNTGYQKGTAVIRCKPNSFDPEAFDVYGPKIIATRETFTDKALESRFLVEEMEGGKVRKDIPRTLDEDFYEGAQNIRNKLLMWRLDNYFKPIERRQDLIEGIHPRLNQIVMPLFSIIKDENVRENLKTFIIKYNTELVSDRGLTWESDIVFAILKLEYERVLSELTMKDIAEEVNREMDFREETLSAKKVGWYLRKKLYLKTEKKRKGFVLMIEKNRKRLDSWKERYGITDADIRGEHANVVNITEEEFAMPTVEELGF